MKENLCQIVYRIINEHINDIKFCVILTLNLPSNYIPTSNSQLIEQVKLSSLDESLKEAVVDVIKDKQYLEDMKRMESDIEFSESQRMITIPVSGLVLSRFCRLENEHKSVLDLWEPARISRRAGESHTPLENAVMKNDCKQLEHVLKSGLSYINEQDSNGWTPLHLSCSYLMNIPRLEITDCLFNYPEIEVKAVNNYGNTPLHYYAHIPVKEEYRTKYRDVLLKFMKFPDVIHIQNHKGETPLHRATLSANPVAARFLLENNADPNVQNE